MTALWNRLLRACCITACFDLTAGSHDYGVPASFAALVTHEGKRVVQLSIARTGSSCPRMWVTWYGLWDHPQCPVGPVVSNIRLGIRSPRSGDGATAERTRYEAFSPRGVFTC